MIDTHLHILPGVDDGPETLEESLSLANALVQEDVHLAVATPHYNDMFPQRSAWEIKERVNDLQQVLDRQGIPLHLFTGHEALIKPGLVEDIQTGRLATLNGSRYLLLELWDQSFGRARSAQTPARYCAGLAPGCKVDWASKDAATHRGLSDVNH